jgi:uncharacterized protein YecE (DUF72 family)
MEKAYHIGCSGYYYPAWKNRFYPEGLPTKNWLEFYSSVFDTVELNGTFYKVPKLSDLKRQASATPEHFRFSAKMNRLITHTSQLRESRQTISEFQELLREGLQGKLMHFLFQMPPSFRYSEENLQRIIDNVPHNPENVVELRHISWWNDTVRQAFSSAGLTFCNVDFPGLNTWFMHTSPNFYLRLHGNPELFKSSYTPVELKAFSVLFPPDAERYSVYFNNTYYDAGYTNARELKELLAH